MATCSTASSSTTTSTDTNTNSTTAAPRSPSPDGPSAGGWTSPLRLLARSGRASGRRRPASREERSGPSSATGRDGRQGVGDRGDDRLAERDQDGQHERRR